MAGLAGGSAFFGSIDDVELSDSESETEAPAQTKAEESVARAAKTASDAAAAAQADELAAKRAKLPSPDELFSQKELARPAFLTTSIEEERHMAFDNRPEPVEPKPWLSKAPSSSAEQEAKQQRHMEAQKRNTGVAVEVAAAAMALSQTYKTAGDTSTERRAAVPIAEMNKRAKAMGSAAADSEAAADGARRDEDRSKSWSVKEKRKRDLGQANREKSYVEEEKRILREYGLPSAGQGFG